MSALGTLPWLVYYRSGAIGPNPPAPADFIVTNDAEFAAANLAATAGDVIQLQDIGTFGTLTITNATGITVRGETPKVPRVRYLKLVGASNCTVEGLYLHPGEETASSQRIINIVDATARSSDGLDIKNCKIYGGNPWDSYQPFDVTVTDGPRMGTTGEWSATNAYLTLPYGIGSTITGSGETGCSGNITIANNEITDVREGVKLGWAGDGVFSVVGNKIARVYQDAVTISLGSGSVNVEGIDISGNEMSDLFAQQQDNENPHGDFIQLTAIGYVGEIPGLKILGNICYYTPGCRGEAQGALISDNEVGYPYVGALIADNLVVSRITKHGLTLIDGSAGGAWTYALRNTFMSNPNNNNPIQNELLTNSVTGVGPVTAAARSVTVFNDATITGNISLVKDNLAEKVDASPTVELVGNINAGLGTTPSAYGSYATPSTGTAWDAVDTAEGYFSAFRTAATTGKGSGIAGNTAAAVLAAWADPSNRPYASIPAWVAWPDVANAGTSETITSGWAFVHSPGADRSVTITGGQFRTASDASGSDATAWAASGTVAEGRYMQVRQTSSASEGTVTTLVWDIGGATGDWSVATASNAEFPVVQSDGEVRFTSVGVPGADSPVATGAFKIKFPATAPASNVDIFAGQNTGGGASTSYIRGVWLPTGLIRLMVYDNVGALVAQVNMSGASLAGQDCEVLWSLDVSQATNADGWSIWVNGVNRSATNGTWNGGDGKAIGWSRVTQAGAVGFLGSGTTYLAAGTEIAMMYLNVAERVDLSNSTNRAKFQPGAIGHDGSGPTGDIPHTFWTGTKAQIESGSGINWGSGAKYIKAGTGSITDVSGDPW